VFPSISAVRPARFRQHHGVSTEHHLIDCTGLAAIQMTPHFLRKSPPLCCPWPAHDTDSAWQVSSRSTLFGNCDRSLGRCHARYALNIPARFTMSSIAATTGRESLMTMTAAASSPLWGRRAPKHAPRRVFPSASRHPLSSLAAALPRCHAAAQVRATFLSSQPPTIWLARTRLSEPTRGTPNSAV
jgi:hypothetical protein